MVFANTLIIFAFGLVITGIVVLGIITERENATFASRRKLHAADGKPRAPESFSLGQAGGRGR